MSALDLDALEAACRDCAAARALKEEADTAWLRMEKSRPRGQQHVSSEEQAVASEAVEADYALDRALDGIAVDERALLDLITRLRAAEARTAWQPIETAPVGVEVLVTRYTSGGILLGGPTHWMPLPDVPEAP